MDLLTPNILILGHSFVRRLKHDLSAGFDPRVKANFDLSGSANFDLSGSANVHLFGVGSLTEDSLRENDLVAINRTAQDWNERSF